MLALAVFCFVAVAPVAGAALDGGLEAGAAVDAADGALVPALLAVSVFLLLRDFFGAASELAGVADAASAPALASADFFFRLSLLPCAGVSDAVAVSAAASLFFLCLLFVEVSVVVLGAALLSSVEAVSLFVLLRDFFAPVSPAAAVSEEAVPESAFFFDFFFDFDSESVAAAESSPTVLSFLAFFLDFFVAVEESSLDDCALANAGETARVRSRQNAAAHRLSLRVRLFMDFPQMGRLGPYRSRRVALIRGGRSLARGRRSAIMPVLRPEVNEYGRGTELLRSQLERRVL